MCSGLYWYASASAAVRCWRCNPSRLLTRRSPLAGYLFLMAVYTLDEKLKRNASTCCTHLSALFDVWPCIERTS